MRGACLRGIAVEQRAAVVGREEPFVGIDDEAIGQLDPAKAGRLLGAASAARP